MGPLISRTTAEMGQDAFGAGDANDTVTNTKAMCTVLDVVSSCARQHYPVSYQSLTRNRPSLQR